MYLSKVYSTRSYSKTPQERPLGKPSTSYLNALSTISARTGTPISSLLVSFALLHEITAIVPFVGIFYASRASGVGEKVVDLIQNARPQSTSLQPSKLKADSQKLSEGDNGQNQLPYEGWMVQKATEYIAEGEIWAARVGRRYGWWGFEKGGKPTDDDIHIAKRNMGIDVMNAVFAYGITKVHILI
ncbi:hypothetical protein FRC02_004441 [Tulasnella sp. 418]|nr:hypothetical protein FRC02_004441 [Tulasnella sp. 418]